MHNRPIAGKTRKHLTIAGFFAIFGCLAVTGGCNYARMTSDAGYDTYETRLPDMPAGSISVEGNTTAYKLRGPGDLDNPLQPAPPVLAQGLRVYNYHCDHCHGPRGNGYGTVGQSFAPLPTNLLSSRVQGQTDGELYFKIGFGYQRHPDLSHTVLEKDLWSVIHFIRKMPQIYPSP